MASSQAFDLLVNMDGKVIAFVPHVTSGSGPVSLNVDGLGAKALRSSPGVELAAGTLISGTPYVAVYRNAGNEWLLRGFFGANPYNVPLGGTAVLRPGGAEQQLRFPASADLANDVFHAVRC